MRCEERTIVLKDGREAILRSPGAADAQEMLQYIRQMCGETEFVGRYPEEVTETLQDEEKLLEETAASSRSIQVSVFRDGKIIGNASISPCSERLKIRHRADFGIAVLRSWWGLGIGKILTEECLRAAAQMGYTLVELSMLEENRAGEKLYRACGFEAFGRLENAVQLKGGRSAAEIRMVRYL